MLGCTMMVSAAEVRITELLTKLSTSWLRAAVADTSVVAFLGRTIYSILTEVRVAVALHRDHRGRRLHCSGIV